MPLSPPPLSSPVPLPPTAPAHPHAHHAHGHGRPDPYHWLRDRESPDVIAYLAAENAYTEAVMHPFNALKDKLFHEMRGRIKEDDDSVPYRKNGYWYYTRYQVGQEYPLLCRKVATALQYADEYSPEELLVNENERAAGHSFYALGGAIVSPNSAVLGVAEDVVGRRIYSLKFKDLSTDRWLPDCIDAVTGDFVFAADNQTLLYTRQDPETLRPCEVWRHVLGTPVPDDVRVYAEEDETFAVEVGKSRDESLLFIHASQTVSDEWWYVQAHQPGGEWQVFLPRQRGHEYSLDFFAGSFFVLTNWQAPNFRLLKMQVHARHRLVQAARSGLPVASDVWEEVVPHRDTVLLEDFLLFDQHLVLCERSQGLERIAIRTPGGEFLRDLRFDDACYTLYLDANPEPQAPALRVVYESPRQPRSIFAYNLHDEGRLLLKETPVLGGFDSSHYATERCFVPVGGGVEVPVSLVYGRGTPRDGTAPLLLYGYGSYGISVDPHFSSSRLSLLDRGMVFAIAHVRGGSEMGRHWYENGKMEHKQNTFTDFIACAEWLAEHGYCSPQKRFAMGGSAGGLLVGAVMNLRPELWAGVVAQVPFVDVVTTMLDDSIPLTTGEYDEWGNPHEPEAYARMLAYSPYDNVRPAAYPNLLVTTGLHDSQVQYWEPAKWVAKLRTMHTNAPLILLHTDMEAGHGGASGRFEALHERALEYAFLLGLCCGISA